MDSQRLELIKLINPVVKIVLSSPKILSKICQREEVLNMELKTEETVVSFLKTQGQM